MTRMEPHSGKCERCDALIIDAEQHAGHVVRLDATPAPDGTYRAHFATRGVWVCVRVAPPLIEDVFFGMRRRPHVCVVPDRQLQLDSTEPAPAGVSLKTTEEALCPSDASTPASPSSP